MALNFGALTGAINDPIGTVFAKASFNTAYTPPVDYTAQQLKDLAAGLLPSPPPVVTGGGGMSAGGGTERKTVQESLTEAYLKKLKPTFTVESPVFGSYTYAPYGEATPFEWQDNITFIVATATAVLIGYTFLVYSIGHNRGRKAASR